MLRNYLLVAVRNLLRNPIISFIHITGFGLGIAAFLFAVQTITFEYSFDKFHKNAGRIYQVASDVTLQNGGIVKMSGVEPPLAPLLKDAIPEITYAARYIPQLLQEPYCVVTYIDTKGSRKSFNELNARYVDDDFLKIFRFKIIQGNNTPLLNSTGIVANVIGIPIAYYLVQLYLERYSARLTFQWWHYALPVALLILVMCVTIAGVLLRAARTNPVESLRSE